MRQRLAAFFAGRYGMDSLSKLTLVLALVAAVLSQVVPSAAVSVIFWAVAIVLLVVTYWRMLSRNVQKRYEENQRYLRATGRLRFFSRGRVERFRLRKTYRFFRCPSCHILLRVPKGKGKIQITCRKCGNRFTKKT